MIKPTGRCSKLVKRYTVYLQRKTWYYKDVSSLQGLDVGLRGMIKPVIKPRVWWQSLECLPSVPQEQVEWDSPLEVLSPSSEILPASWGGFLVLEITFLNSTSPPPPASFPCFSRGFLSTCPTLCRPLRRWQGVQWSYLMVTKGKRWGE